LFEKEVFMRRWLIQGVGIGAAVIVLAAAVHARAETFSLQIKRVEQVSDRTTGPPTEAMFRSTYPQHFYMQTGLPGMSTRTGGAEFGDVVKKEPASYNAKDPLRFVAKLGSQQFGFVLDSKGAEPKPAGDAGEPKPAPADGDKKEPPDVQPYSRLYFDANHNGDLTDDPVVEGLATGPRLIARGYANFSFPRVDVTIEADGTKIDYAFFLSGYCHSQYLNEKQRYQYASVSLTAAAYRDGEITLDGKKVRVVVLDFNSNGRFDDAFAIDETITVADGTLYPRQGDMIHVDPKPEQAAYRYGYDVTSNDDQQFVGKLINIGGRFHELSISPAGDTLTLTPSSRAVGHVSNPNKGYRAVVYSDQGMLKISGDEAGRAPLPEGQWKLLQYTIDRTSTEPAKPADGGATLLQSLAQALLGAGQTPPQLRYSIVSARAKRDFPAVEVRAGETTELRFGAPYKPIVSVSSPQGDGRVSLGLSLVGAGGEVCNNLVVDGGRPPKPQFTITDPDGKVVESGSFEYG
jgi:hypothetical protein